MDEKTYKVEICNMVNEINYNNVLGFIHVIVKDLWKASIKDENKKQEKRNLCQN